MATPILHTGPGKSLLRKMLSYWSRMADFVKRPLDPRLERQLAALREKLAQAAALKAEQAAKHYAANAPPIHTHLESIEIPPIEVLRDPAKKKRLP